MNQLPMPRPALVEALLTDNDGNIGESLGGDVEAGRVAKLGSSRSRFQRTRISLNSKVAVKRPHILTKSNVVL
jgi:hypothetical protein